MIGHNNPPQDADWANSPGNWIALSRRVLEHPIVGAGQPVRPDSDDRKTYSRCEAWIDLLCLAQYKPSRIDNKGQVMTLAVGQLMGARAFLAARWNWTEKTVRGFLDRLEKEGMVARWADDGETKVEETGQQKGQHKDNKCNVITICNYAKYQLLVDAIETYVGASKKAAKGPARGHRRATEGPELNKGNNNNNPPTPLEGGLFGSDEMDEPDRPDLIAEQFEIWWKSYPPTVRKVGKGECAALFRQAITGERRPGKRSKNKILDHRTVTAEVLLAAIVRYAAAKPDPEYVPAPATWLNQGRWMDSNTPSEPERPWWQDPDKLAKVTHDQWRNSIGKHANGMWPVARLGPPPGDHRCVVPKDIVRELKLELKYTPAGLSRGQH